MANRSKYEHVHRDRSRLSKREIEVMDRAILGESDYQIGKALSISARTVRFHRSNAKRILGVRTPIELGAKYRELKD